ncbi:MAG: DUF6746 family protein [Oleiphilaceae bacterium]|nr:DUF6746 family protein [Oleiphilaceae bacterium]
MTRTARFALPLLLSMLPFSLMAEERYDHFEAKESNTLEEAVDHFSEYNARLAQIVSQDELSAEDLNKVHELTYTIENALAKIQEESDAMAVALEEVHQASERSDAETVKSQGKQFLDSAQTLVQ